MDSEKQRETTAIVTGLGLVGLALYCGLSLYSYTSVDVMGYQSASQGQVTNLGGLLGAKVAHHLKCIYGVGAWVVNFFMLMFGAMICTARSLSGTILRGFGAILFTAVVCAWAGTLELPLSGYVPDPESVIHYPAGIGGLLGGRYLGQALVSYFGSVGVYLVLVTVGLFAGFLVAQEITERTLAIIGRGCMHAGSWTMGLFARLKTEAKDQLGGMIPVGAPSGVHPAVGILTDDRTTATVRGRRSRPSAEDIQLLEDPPTREVDTQLDEEVDEEATKETVETPKASTKRATADLITPSESTADESKPKNTAKEERAEKEVVETLRRKDEAKRQAEEAEQNRLKRQEKEKELLRKETEALAKMEKERVQKEADRRFLNAMTPGKGKSKTSEKEEEEQDPTKESLPDAYTLPDIGLLQEKDIMADVSSDDLKDRGAKLVVTLWEFKIGAKLVDYIHGPTITMFELFLDPGIKVSRVIGLADNLAMAMKAEHGVRIVAPLPGRDTIGIEVPNSEDCTMRMRPVLESTKYRSGKFTLPLILGRDATGTPLITDLVRMPHLLIAGTTGSGKSVCVNSIILSIMLTRRPHDVKLILVDPKQVEMTDFKGIPHLLSPVVTDMKMAAGVLTWAVQKMDERYGRMGKVGVRNIASFNKLSPEDRIARIPKDENPDDYFDPMPYVVVIVDEFADLMMTAGKEIEQSIARLAQKARAAGIHVILATQRPSNDVVTGLIKTNLPCRICFQVKSKIDSRIVLDASGAEKLAGKGDMLFIPPGSSQLIRAKGVFVEDAEITSIVEACKSQASPIYSDEIERVANGGDDENMEAMKEMPLDERFEEGVECFLSLGRASTSLLQRRMGLGYTRAAKLCDQMEARGIVGPDRGAKGRELLITDASWDSYKRSKFEKSAWGPMGSKDNPGPSQYEEEESLKDVSAELDEGVEEEPSAGQDESDEGEVEEDTKAEGGEEEEDADDGEEDEDEEEERE